MLIGKGASALYAPRDGQAVSSRVVNVQSLLLVTHHNAADTAPCGIRSTPNNQLLP